MNAPGSAKEFDGRRAIVTGGASGIGLATAHMLAAGGASVACLDITPDITSHITRGALAHPLVGIRCDVSDDSSVVAAVAVAVERLGGIDIVISNAGIGAQGTVEHNDDAEWLRVFDVNVFGMARVVRAAMPHLRRSSAPAVVLTSSIAAWAGLQQRAVYSASKGAVQALGLAMATDCLADGIRVNMVAPGTADTPWVGRLLDLASDPTSERAALEARQPMGRLVSADEVAHAICYLASPRSGSTTGTVLAVDGGMHGLRPRPRA